MHSFEAMNTTMLTLGLPVSARQQVESWFRYVEQKLSRFRPDSELSKLNQSNGRRFQASALLYELVATATHYHKITDGLFHPFLGRVLCQLGYDRSFETIAQQRGLPVASKSKPRPTALAANGLQPISLDPNSKIIALPSRVAVDLGGIAKGWSAQKMCDWLKKDGVRAGVIDAGGDIVVWGIEHEKDWEFTVADPFEPEQDLIRLELKRAAGIATSSTIKRSWTDLHHRRLHHIVDPRTLQPSRSDLIQVTVFAPDLTMAEVYAKCLLILGSRHGASWLQAKQPELGFIGVRADRSVITGAALYRYCSEWSVQT